MNDRSDCEAVMESEQGAIVRWVRGQFPALARVHDGRQCVYFDGPAGSQVPRRVADAMSEYLLQHNANLGGAFITSHETGERVSAAHQAVADLLGGEANEVVFGQNMTSLTFALSRSLAKTWSPGDRIVVSRLDHDANVRPWVLAARDAQVDVDFVELQPGTLNVDIELLERTIGPRTRLVAMTCASNATGGIQPVKAICEMARRAGALTFLDAVHWAPHGRIDVVDYGCDFLACSAYKFFGPHIGMMWGRRQLLEQLDAYKVRPADDDVPNKWMTGTQSHESIVGTMAAIDYLADLGRHSVGDPELPRKQALDAAYRWITQYEQQLSRRLLAHLRADPRIRVYGISDPEQVDLRVATFSIRVADEAPRVTAARLAGQGIFTWHGHYYALELSESLGLEPEGMLRIGLLHYNTGEEIDWLMEVL